MSKLKLSNLGKLYRVYPTPRDRLYELLSGRKRHQEHWALTNVDLEVAKGEAVGVIGNNGAGKSTLLKLVTGTIIPSTGQVEYSGRLTAILELGTGFHPDFSGTENLFYSGVLMGVPREEVAARYDQIVAFSELGDAISQPLKTYSTGMVVRLAFSLVTMVDPDILIIDEALAVGDRNFQKKCIERMMEIQQSGTTILFCSHSMHHITQFCDRAIWLDDGVVKSLGSVSDVVDHYIAENSIEAKSMVESNVKSVDTKSDLHCRVTRLTIKPSSHIQRGKPLTIGIDFTVLKSDNYVLGIAVDRKETSSRLVAETSLENGVTSVYLMPGDYSVNMELKTESFRSGVYTLYAGLLHDSLMKIEDLKEIDIEIKDSDNIKSPSMIRADINWDIEGKLFRKPK
ncbi:MAG: ABC transporter ATP-binding protein [Candidatus Thiodiazotropha sp. (ex. Lucinoma kazani)]